MDSALAQDAINQALEGNWGKAIEVNSTILRSEPEDIDALNRLARAYAETGSLEKAKSATKKVLKLDPTNAIATKCLDKWANFKKPNNIPHSSKNVAKIFIEEGTKTKIIGLINLGEQSVIGSLDCGDNIKLSAAKHRVNILTQDNKYIGRFPDNLALNFINLMNTGASFESVIKSVTKDEVKVLVYANSKNDH